MLKQKTRLQFPTTDITTCALDILLENTGKRFNGRELQEQIQKKLGRRVNYSGLLKQLRAYSAKPGWNLVLSVEPQFAKQSKKDHSRDYHNRQILQITAQDNLVSHKLHILLHKLKDVKATMEELSMLKEEFDSQQNQVFSDPYSDLQKARIKRAEMKAKLESLAERLS